MITCSILQNISLSNCRLAEVASPGEKKVVRDVSNLIAAIVNLDNIYRKS